MPIGMSVSLNKNDVRTINKFISKFPGVVDRATGKTAEKGTVIIRNKTPRSPVGGGTRRAWEFKRLRKFIWLISNPLKHVAYLEEGTGLHGPKKKLIRPKKSKSLRWVDPKTGNVVFATFTRGMKAVHMMAESIPVIQKMLTKEIKNSVAKEWKKKGR